MKYNMGGTNQHLSRLSPSRRCVSMLTTHLAVVRNGRIELADPASLEEGSHLLVTILPAEDDQFWMQASQPSLKDIWDNEQDDTYAELLKT